MERVIDGPALPTLLAAVALTLALTPDPQSDRKAEVSTGPGVVYERVDHVAILGELAPGLRLSSWSVESLEVAPAPDAGDQRVQVTVARGGVSFRVQVVRRGTDPYPAPRSTRTRDLFYTSAVPAGATVPDADRNAILEALATRVEARE